MDKKKLTTLFFSLILILNITACSSQTVMNHTTPPKTNQTDSSNHSKDSKVDTSHHKPESGEDFGTAANAVPVVYMTSEITAKSLLKVYQAVGKEVKGNKIAVTLFPGEVFQEDDLAPELIRDVVQYVDGTIVGCKPEWEEPGSGTDTLYQTAEDYGYTEIADVVIVDEEGSAVIPVADGEHLTENYVGADFEEYDGFLLLSHFKPHTLAGFEGSILNLSIGFGSDEGKCLIYTAGKSRESSSVDDPDGFLETMAEAGKSVVDAWNGNLMFINVIDHFSIGCDCGTDSIEPDIHDIGILASKDPIALDQACVDYIYMAEENETFVDGIEEHNAEHVLEYGEEIGLGNTAYTVVSIDK